MGRTPVLPGGSVGVDAADHRAVQHLAPDGPQELIIIESLLQGQLLAEGEELELILVGPVLRRGAAVAVADRIVDAQLEGPGGLALEKGQVPSGILGKAGGGGGDVGCQPVDPDDALTDDVVIIDEDQGEGLRAFRRALPGKGEGQLGDTLLAVRGLLAVLGGDGAVLEGGGQRGSGSWFHLLFP